MIDFGLKLRVIQIQLFFLTDYDESILNLHILQLTNTKTNANIFLHLQTNLDIIKAILIPLFFISDTIEVLH